MNEEENELAPTRRSLIDRLKNWRDEESWKVFFDTYWRLIYKTGVKAGLSPAEAEDAVQETVVAVAQSMPTFEYDAQKGSFKSWLMHLTRWRITDQIRKRQVGIVTQPRKPEDSPTNAELIDQVEDPAVSELEVAWENEWENNLMAAALERVKRKVEAKQYQIFDLYAFKKWPVARVARTMKVSRGKVYLTKHRLGRLFKKELQQFAE